MSNSCDSVFFPFKKTVVFTKTHVDDLVTDSLKIVGQY